MRLNFLVEIVVVFSRSREPERPPPQTRAAAISARCAWLPLPFQSQYAPHHAGNPLPILGLNGELLLAPRRDGVKLGLAVIVGSSHSATIHLCCSSRSNNDMYTVFRSVAVHRD